MSYVNFKLGDKVIARYHELEKVLLPKLTYLLLVFGLYINHILWLNPPVFPSRSWKKYDFTILGKMQTNTLNLNEYNPNQKRGDHDMSIWLVTIMILGSP